MLVYELSLFGHVKPIHFPHFALLIHDLRQNGHVHPDKVLILHCSPMTVFSMLPIESIRFSNLPGEAHKSYKPNFQKSWDIVFIAFWKIQTASCCFSFPQKPKLMNFGTKEPNLACKS